VVYPNPAKDKIEISFGNFTGAVDIHILTADGKVVYKSGLKHILNKRKEKIDISLLPEGICFIRSLSSGGKIFGIRKFVKTP